MHQATFSPDVASPKAARRFVAAVLAHESVVSELAVLLVSELATNAVLHARTDFSVHVSIRDGRIRVEVHDSNERPPVIGHTPTEATSGRGLHLVQELAAGWGVESRPEGKVVWFQVPAESNDREDAFAV